MNGTDTMPTTVLPLWRKVVPFAVATILLGAVLRGIDGAQLAASMRSVSIAPYVATVFALAVGGLLIDAATATVIYRRLVGTLAFGDLLAVRAAAVLPGLVNFHIGQAWLTWILVKRLGRDPYRASAATIVVNASAMAALIVMAAVAAGVAEIPHAPGWLLPLVVGGVGVMLGYLLLLALRPAALARRRLFAPLFHLGVGGHLWALGVRLPSVVVGFAIVWLPLRYFGVAIPIVDALAVVPPVVVLAALPITPAGLGTRDMLAAGLLVGFATGTSAEQRAAIVACTLTTATVLSLIQIGLALAFTPRARRLRGAVSEPQRPSVSASSSAT